VATRCKLHKLSDLSSVAHKCGDGQKEKWKVENVHRLHGSEQMSSKG
jgi:hypothetical protein